MALQKLSHDQLLKSAHAAVDGETKAITNVVRHFREIYARKLHLERGYPSLFIMAVKQFGYDKQAAQRRVNAVMLSIDMPETIEKIDQGSLCLQTAADIQTFLNKQRGAKRPYSLEQKRLLLETCSGLSTRKVQVELATLDPMVDFRESKKLIAKDRVQITYTSSTALEDKIERIRNLLSHINPYMRRDDLLDHMAEKTLDAIDPVRKAVRVMKRKANVSSRETGDSLSAQRMEFSEEVVSEAGEIQLVARFDERSRHIPANESHEVWKRNDGRGCDYVDPVTKRRCGTAHLVQRDHLVEYSRGGSHDHGNLQLLCGAHNRLRWHKRSKLCSPRKAYVA